MKERLTVAQALVRFLAAQFSERDGQTQRLIPSVWAIFGHGNVGGLGQALHQEGPRVGLPTFRPQNEQAMVHLAAAYAKHTRRRATLACTTSIGPGALNMLTAAAGAMISRLPVLLLPSDYFAHRRTDPVLQQLEHPSQFDWSVNEAFRPISRFFARLTRPEQLPAALLEAMRILTDPVETGAVTLALPEDLQTEAYFWPSELFAPRTWSLRRPPPEPGALRAAAQLLREAQAPLIVAGGGVLYSEAEQLLATLAERWGIPVVETQAGKGALPWDHPYALGPLGANGGRVANELARRADLVLAVGTRLGDFTTASRTIFQHPNLRVVGLNVDPKDAHKLWALPLVADAREGLEGLAELLEGYQSPLDPQEIARQKAAWQGEVDAYLRPRTEALLSQAELIGALWRVYGGRATVVNAAGSLPGDLLKLWRPEDARSYHVEYGFSCMGYEIPAGLGIKLAEPEREVVVLIGDGSYLMMNSELVTAAELGLELTVVIVDNQTFGSIQGLQQSLGSPPFGNARRVAVDFAAHAAAMGAQTWKVEAPEQLEGILKEARRARGVRVVVVPVSLERLPNDGWWEVPPAEVSDQPEVEAARRRYEHERTRQRDL